MRAEGSNHSTSSQSPTRAVTATVAPAAPFAITAVSRLAPARTGVETVPSTARRAPPVGTSRLGPPSGATAKTTDERASVALSASWSSTSRPSSMRRALISDLTSSSNAAALVSPGMSVPSSARPMRMKSSGPESLRSVPTTLSPGPSPMLVTQTITLRLSPRWTSPSPLPP